MSHPGGKTCDTIQHLQINQTIQNHAKQNQLPDTDFILMYSYL